MANPNDCPSPTDFTPEVKSTGLLMQPVVCEPNAALSSSVQDAINDRELSSLTVFDKTGDCVLPANIGVRFYNCTFNKFDATAGGNVLYFENCTFLDPLAITGANFIMAGSKLRAGGTVSQSQGQLIPIIKVNPNFDPTAIPPIDIIPDYILGEEGIDLVEPWEPNIYSPCVINDSTAFVSYSAVQSDRTIWEWTQDVINFIDNIEDKFMCIVDTFSSYMSYIDKFLNIPFTLVSLIKNSFAKFIGPIFSKIDNLLGPIFTAVKSIEQLISKVNQLISTVKSVATRIAVISMRSYLKIKSAKTILATNLCFALDSKSRLDCSLIGNIIATNGSVCNILTGSKALIKTCQSISGGGQMPVFLQSLGGVGEVSNVGTITGQGSCFSLSGNSVLKLFGIKVVTSTGAFPTIESRPGPTEPDETGKVSVGRSLLHLIGVDSLLSTGGTVMSCTGSQVTMTTSIGIASNGTAPAIMSTDSEAVFKNVKSIYGPVVNNTGSVFVSKSESVTSNNAPAATVMAGGITTFNDCQAVGTLGGTPVVNAVDGSVIFKDVASVTNEGGPLLNVFNDGNIIATGTMFKGNELLVAGTVGASA